MPKITLEQLKNHGARKSQIELFIATFGREVEVTAEWARQYARTFDFDWACRELLKEGDLKAYWEARPGWSEVPHYEVYMDRISTAFAELYIKQNTLNTPHDEWGLNLDDGKANPTFRNTPSLFRRILIRLIPDFLAGRSVALKVGVK